MSATEAPPRRRVGRPRKEPTADEIAQQIEQEAVDDGPPEPGIPNIAAVEIPAMPPPGDAETMLANLNGKDRRELEKLAETFKDVPVMSAPVTSMPAPTPPIATPKPVPARKPLAPWEILHAKLEITMPLLWYPRGDRSEEPYPAVCTFKADNPKVIGLSVFAVHPSGRGNCWWRAEDGVRHVDDPDYTTSDRTSIGAWDFPPWLKKILLQ